MQKVSNRKVDISHEASTRNDYELIHVYDLEGMTTGMKEEKFEKQLVNYRARHCHVTVHIISKKGYLQVRRRQCRQFYISLPCFLKKNPNLVYTKHKKQNIFIFHLTIKIIKRQKKKIYLLSTAGHFVTALSLKQKQLETNKVQNLRYKTSKSREITTY